jgi:hypothetical protein
VSRVGAGRSASVIASVWVAYVDSRHEHEAHPL